MRSGTHARTGNTLAVLAAATLLWLTPACDSASEPLIRDPTIVGRITAIDTARSTFRILVEEDPRVSEPLAPRGHKIWFGIGDETCIFDARAGQAVPADVTVLDVGSEVAVVTHGGIADSYPQQAGADTVVIVD
jgi:hypothetical protein